MSCVLPAEISGGNSWNPRVQELSQVKTPLQLPVKATGWALLRYLAQTSAESLGQFPCPQLQGHFSLSEPQFPHL